MTARRTLRLVADDLTGALDAAAALLPAFGELAAGCAGIGTGLDALDAGTRELTRDAAAVRMTALAEHLRPAPGRLNFLKVDSLLRGNAGAELAAVLRHVAFEQVVIAPAMPFQRRVTRGGRQHVFADGRWSETGEDLAAALRGLGLTVALAAPGDVPSAGITIHDAETEADLTAIAQAGLASGRTTLWVGTAGLARALADALGIAVSATPVLSGPVLGLIGSNHPAIQAQVQNVGRFAFATTGSAQAVDVAALMAREGAAIVTCALDAAMPRADAAMRIADIFADLVQRLQRPGLLVASGGETLCGLLAPLGARALGVIGEFEPGAPVSRLIGGRWDSLTVLSKSGAFGSPDFLARAIAATQPARKALAS
jgi:D-threonate/D-erythronate kinase